MDNKKMNSTGVEDHILDVEHLSMYFTTKNRGKKSTVSRGGNLLKVIPACRVMDLGNGWLVYTLG